MLSQAAQSATADPIASAAFADPTDRYDHCVLGDCTEYGALDLTLTSGRRLKLSLPTERVFEDTAPRLADLDGDGAPEAIVVESHRDLGARLSVYGPSGLIAATPYIGQTHRWLAPIGAADLDGDGKVEVAYVDRPHLARILRVWRFADGSLLQIASAPGLTNHRIGESAISGGIRDCGAGPEMVTADAAWQTIMSSRLVGGTIVSVPLGSMGDPADMTAALTCR